MSHSRRDFLKTSLATSTLLSLGPAVPTFLANTAKAATAKRNDGDTVLVVLQLAGGNDGLNTVVPFEDDEYGRNRTTLRLPTDKLLKIDTHLGFHPQMEAFARLYKEGHLSILQGIGYPNPNGDHFQAMQDWHTAQPHQTGRQTGWLGRMADRYATPGKGDMPVAFVGQIKRPFSLTAKKTFVPGINSLEDWKLKTQGDAQAAETGDNPLLDFVQQTSVEAHTTSQDIEAIAKTGSSNYPHYPAAGRLRTVAQLIRADLGVRVFFTELGGNEPGGFDNHANQRGNHGALLHQLSESVAAFVDDLKRDNLLDRVLLMTFSEFGRTVAENGRHGTGHGSAAPVFLAGGKVRGGLIGEHPSMTELENGGPKHHTDFRRVYATMLDRWLGFDSRPILGKRYEPLDVLKS